MRVGLVQLSSSDDPAANLVMTRELISKAASQGARLVLTPEVTNCVSTSRTHQNEVLRPEREDETLAVLRQDAARLNIWLLLGSLALKNPDGDGRFVNRSILIDPQGLITARYDKLHMFDVTLSETETYRESSGYQPGDRASIVDVDDVCVGLSICYDLRFPGLYRDLAKAGARILTIPSAFAPDTGVAHWEILLRARAIECGAFVVAPAQCGEHSARRGRSRRTYGHSLVVDPWGVVLADGGELSGVTVVDLDLSKVDDARRRIPSLMHDRDYRLDP